jgi:hypothetical protein
VADTFTTNAGSGGSTFASDDIGPGVHYPRLKLVHGVDGTNDGDVARTNPFPVQAYLDASTMHSGATQLTPKFVIVDAATSGDNTILAAVTSKKIRVLAAFLVSAGTVNVRFESGAGGTALTGQMNLIANTGFVLPFNPVGWFETASNTLLNLELSAAISVDGSLVYVEV